MVAAVLADNVIQPFRIEALDVRGRLVRLGGSIDAILVRHGYPAPVSVLLGEALALTAGLAGALKFDGTFTTQIQGDGPIRLLIADYRTDGALRGYVGFDPKMIGPASEGTDGGRNDAPGDMSLFGAGHLAFTVDRGPEQDRYQGLVPLEGDTLAAAAQSYLTRSEQLRADIEVTALRWPAEDGNPEAWRAGCLVVQQMPASDGRADYEPERNRRWRQTREGFARLRRADLADPLAIAPTLIGPLFRGHDIRLHRPRPLRFECRCSEDRATNVVRSLAVEQRADFAVDGRLELTCDYCNARYLFDVDGSPVQSG